MKPLLKYLGYFSAVAGAVTTIYFIGVFFANLQNSIDKIGNSVIKLDDKVTTQGGKIESIEYEVKEISSVQLKQGSFNNAIDRSYRDHLKKSKDLIDEYTKYLELQIENEKKKSFTDSVSQTIKHSFKYEKVK
jgi:preprotein translocase subunit SecF